MKTDPSKVREDAAMPDRPHTVRVPDELWAAAQEEAWRRRETVADAIRRALEDYVSAGQGGKA